MILSLINTRNRKIYKIIYKKINDKSNNFKISYKYDKSNNLIITFTDDIINTEIMRNIFTKHIKDDNYKIMVKSWGKGNNDENITFQDSVKEIANKYNITKTIQRIEEILNLKKEYYNLSKIYLTELTFRQVVPI